MRRFGFWKVLKFVVFAAVAIGAVGFIVMSLWNWLAPALFGAHLITFGQAIGLFVLARLLVGGFRGRGGRGGGQWRQRMRERWEQMTPEEREQMRSGFRGRCGGGRRNETPAAP